MNIAGSNSKYVSVQDWTKHEKKQVQNRNQAFDKRYDPNSAAYDISPLQHTGILLPQLQFIVDRQFWRLRRGADGGNSESSFAIALSLLLYPCSNSRQNERERESGGSEAPKTRYKYRSRRSLGRRLQLQGADN
ncbi:hypothetical protein DM860_013721 [Cuscuta australis]|uniref:Uncharacterized protein n=1 Tax=Cuscuta australis TaxID=267555 RepID=A0A328EAB4_9ASTE|nr:hypothetical protein DM860_013721 [Cuscuta australis]